MIGGADVVGDDRARDATCEGMRGHDDSLP